MAKKKPMKKLVYWRSWFKKTIQPRFGPCPGTYDIKFVAYMNKHGFKRSPKGISQNVWINHDKGIVIKRPYLTFSTSTRQQILDILCPTIQTRSGWLFQPVCDTSRPQQAIKTITKKLAALRQHIYIDRHTGNVGHYRNKAVLFDW